MPEDDDRAIIEMRQVVKVYHGQRVLDGISLAIERGRTTAVIGPSGCGKTVLLKHMIGLIRPDAGEVYFDGREITRMSERKLVPIRRRVGFLFQGGALFDSMTVAENVHFPLQEHGVRSRAQLAQRCEEVLGLVGASVAQPSSNDGPHTWGDAMAESASQPPANRSS